MFLSSCLKADCPGRATCFTLKHLSRYVYILFSVNWFRVFCSWYLSSILLLLHKMFHSGLPPLLSVSTVWSITVCACRYLAFPQPQAAPLCCISLSSTSGESLSSYCPIFPVLCTPTLFPWTSQAVQAWHTGSPWADQTFYYVPFSSCSSSLQYHPRGSAHLSPFCCALCFKQSS